jgi:hypothetical protein
VESELYIWNSTLREIAVYLWVKVSSESWAAIAL